MTKQQREAGANVPEDVPQCRSARSRTLRCVLRASEKREREGSDVLGAREDRGKGGREASKHSAKVGRPQRRRSQEVSQYLAESRCRSEALTGALGHQCWLNSTACVNGHRTAVQERKRDGTREILPRTTTTPVVLKASADHAVAESRRRGENRTAFSERQW